MSSRLKIRKSTIFSIIGVFLPIVGIVFGVAQIKQIQDLFIQANFQPANFVVDTQGVTGPLSRTWVNLAQGGESPHFSLKPMMDDLKLVKPKYIRIDHLYDFYIKVDRSSSGLTYDFSKLDQLLTEMKLAGALPFVSLSYTPSILNSDIVGVPSNWAEYTSIIRRTIEHISGKSELNLMNVYYEVWNEPDLFGQWKVYGPKNYLDLYRAASFGAGLALNTQPYKFGGPATTKLYDNWIDGLLNAVLAENLRLDFYSWHHYNQDPNAYISDVERLKQKLRQYPTRALDLEYIISEWGIDSNNNPAYDNTMSAAHLVASVIIFPPNLSKAFLFEIQDGKNAEGNEYWGRWGLYTHTDFGSHAKPGLGALKLLNLLGDQELSIIGQGTHVKGIAVKKGNTIQLLITNYDAENKNAESVPVQFKRIKPGIYTLTKTYLGRTKTTEQITAASDTYTTTIPIVANSVVLYELTPQ